MQLGLLPSASIQFSNFDAVNQWIVFMKIIQINALVLSHGVLDGIQLINVDIAWFAGIEPHNVVSHFCIFDHVVVVGLVHRLPIPPLDLVVLLNCCSLVLNHLTLCPSNDAESTPIIDVLKHLPCTIQDAIFNFLGEVGCPDMHSKSIPEYVVVHKPGACDAVEQHFFSSTIYLK